MNDPVEIHLLDRRVRLLQPAHGFRTSLDSVMLAAACPARAGMRVLDMGSGVGGAAFCLLTRVPGIFLTGVELQKEYVALARENAVLNKKAATFVSGDIRSYEPEKRFDHVICNPPYLEAGAHTPSPMEEKALANGHLASDLSLQDWLDAGFRALKSGGSLTLIHRADQTDRIVQGLGRRFGAVEFIPLWPRAGHAAKRVVVRAIKDRKSPTVLHPGLILHEENGAYTPAADTILRDGAALYGTDRL